MWQINRSTRFLHGTACIRMCHSSSFLPVSQLPHPATGPTRINYLRSFVFVFLAIRINSLYAVCFGLLVSCVHAAGEISGLVDARIKRLETSIRRSKKNWPENGIQLAINHLHLTTFRNEQMGLLYRARICGSIVND